MIKHIQFKNTPVRFSDTGKGRAIVLLHGFPETLDAWNAFTPALAKHFRVIAIDFPGHGETPSIGYIHTMELFAECVKTVMDSLGLRRYLIAGHSMGGYAALAFADKYRGRLCGLCLFHSTALSESSEKKREREKVIEIVKKDPRHYISDAITSLFAPENVIKFGSEINELKERAFRISSLAIINAQEGMKERPPYEGLLTTLDIPVLFIAGRKDRVIPYESVLKQADTCRHPTVLLLENSAHMGFLEEKELCQKTLTRFARKCFRSKS